MFDEEAEAVVMDLKMQAGTERSRIVILEREVLDVEG